MTVLRELVAKLGFQVDEAGFKKAADGVEKIKAGLAHADGKLKGARAGFAGAGHAASQLGQHAHAAGAGLEHAGKGMEHAAEHGSKLAESLIGIVEAVGFEEIIRHCLELADEVETTEAVLQAVFGHEGSEAVQTWAAATGEWLGRSKDDLAAAAAGIGSLVQPMVGSSEKAQQMSEKLTEMGVDLASVFGGSDADAIDALKGGMSGMGRGLKRYGIVLEDTTLQEYAHTKGIGKKVGAMTVAQKAELTYGFLIARTSKYAGDARKHSDSYTNSTKRLAAQLKGLGTDIGKNLLPVAAKLITGLGTLVTNFREVAAKSYIVQSALAALAAGFVVMKGEAIAAFAVPFVSIVLLAAALDEIVTTLTGGKTVIGAWIDKWGGLGTVDSLVRSIGEGLKEIHKLGYFGAVKQAVTDVRDLAGDARNRQARVDQLKDQLARESDPAKKQIIVHKLIKQLQYNRDVSGAIANGTDRAGRGLGAELETPAAGQASASAVRELGLSSSAPSHDGDNGQARVHVPPGGGRQHVTNITVHHGPTTMHVGSGASAADAARAAKLTHANQMRGTREALKHGGG